MELKEVMINQETAKNLEEAGDMNEVIRILKTEGVNATEEGLMAMLYSQDDELTEDALENVTGGLSMFNPFGIGFKILWTLIKQGKIKLQNIPGNGSVSGGR